MKKIRDNLKSLDHELEMASDGLLGAGGMTDKEGTRRAEHLRRYRAAYENLVATVPKEQHSITVEMQATYASTPADDLEETLLENPDETTMEPEIIVINTMTTWERVVDRMSVR
jgi:hypothetical protein